MFFGAPQWERHHLIHRICFGHQATMQEAEKTWCFRCRFCGLLTPNGKAMHSHLLSCHPYSCSIYNRHPENYEPWRILHTKLPPVSGSLVLSNHYMGADPFSGLALRQPSAMVTSMEVSHAYVKFFANLLKHVDWAGIAAATPKEERLGISVAEWVSLACLSCSVPWHVRRASPNFWRCLPEALLTDTFRGVPLSPAAARGQGVSVCLAEVCQQRTSEDIDAAGEHLCLVVQAGQSFMHELGCSHEDNVVYSHGDHVPLSVRNGAVVAFWLPDVLAVDFAKMSSREAKAFWDPRVEAFLEVAAYVRQRMSAYRWPDEFELRAQYRDLLLHWARLSRRPEVHEILFRPADSYGEIVSGSEPAGISAVGSGRAEPAGISAVGSGSSEPAGLLEHGTDIILRGLEFRYVFQWEVFWEIVHTGQLPSGAALDFAPDKYAAAFAVWHFAGMFGTSEAHAESMGNILKRYAKSVSTSRVIESTILRAHGLTGCGSGSEDAFLELCWSHFFGSTDAATFTFQCRNSQKRQKRYTDGKGSKTLQKYVAGADGARHWSQRDLLQVAEQLDQGARVTKSTKWRTALKDMRQSEAG